MAKTKKKLLPKDLEALLKEADIPRLKTLFSSSLRAHPFSAAFGLRNHEVRERRWRHRPHRGLFRRPGEIIFSIAPDKDLAARR
jgi:hypothetical protein